MSLTRDDGEQLFTKYLLSSAHVDKNYRNVSVVDVLQVEKLGTHPQTLLAKIFPQLYHALSFKKFHFPYIYETVLNDPKIQDVINMSTRQALEDSNADDDPALFAAMLKRQHERAVKILTALRSTFSDVILRVWGDRYTYQNEEVLGTKQDKTRHDKTILYFHIHQEGNGVKYILS
ncbi:hypothetical protein J6590_075503 [Homalodisca vitripennis]|nr:hypothetical protein J6590_075503 [Homalodisca vitripennis]